MIPPYVYIIIRKKLCVNIKYIINYVLYKHRWNGIALVQQFRIQPATLRIQPVPV